MALTPSQEYRSRLVRLQEQRAGLGRRDHLFIACKIAAGGLTLVLAVWLAKYHAARIAWLLAPLGSLIALFVLHERVLQALRTNRRLRSLYEHGQARLEDRWFAANGLETAEEEETGERYLAATHPYARDLDLFGPGSLYHLLCSARTRVGQDTLAAWLLAAAPAQEVALRQAAVRELAPMLDFCERWSLAGAALAEATSTQRTPADSSPDRLLAWSQSPLEMERRLRLPAFALALLWAGSIVGWQTIGGPFWTVAAAIATMAVRAFGWRFRDRLRQSLAGIAAAAGDLEVLASVLRVLEQERFSSGKLTSLQAQLRSSDMTPSQALSSLARRVDWLASADNWFVKIFDGFLFWRLQAAIAVEDWRRVHGRHVGAWLAAVGEMEALAALSVFAYENPEAVFPSFSAEGPLLDIEEFAHPLLPRDRAVRNSLRLDRRPQLIVISGPNMAGKSTFLRGVGVNVVLAQAGAPVRARAMRLSGLNVAASICILDSLQGGLSRFYAEILRLKEIDALSRGGVPVLFLLDELLSGTNSHDRRAGTEAVVRALVARNAIGLVTTHDLALAEIAEGLNGQALNCHFSDRYEQGQLHFDYKLTPGVAQTSNALELMRSIGLEV